MKKKTFKALLVGGTVADARLIGQSLAHVSTPVELARVASVKDALKTFSKGGIDLLLLKLPRSASRAQNMFSAVHAASPSTPVIVVAGEGQQETTARLLREGAASWLPAGEIGSRAFAFTVRRTLGLEVAEPPTRGEEVHARTAAALRASEERYSSLVSNLPVGVYRSMPDGRIIEANDAAAEMLGFENATALRAVNASDLYVEPKDRTVVLDKLSTTRTFFAEFQLNRRDGRTIWVRDFPRAVLNAQGEIEYVDGVLVDVTDKRMAEEALRAAHGELESRVAARTAQLAEANESLRREIAEHQLAVAARRESEERFRALAENSLDVIMRFDRGYRHLYVNPPVEAQTGFKPSSFIGRTHRELGFPETLCELWETAIQQVFSARREHRIEFELPSHIWLDWQLVPEFAPDGSVAYVLTAARDITDRKLAEAALERSHEDLEHRVAERTAELAGTNAALQAEIAERKRAAAALQDSEERFRRLSQAAFEGIAISDEGRLVDVNARFAEMFGYALSEMSGRDVRDLVVPEHRDEVRRLMLSGYEAAYETVCLRKDGSRFPVEVHARSLPFGKRMLRITAIRDITERRKAEEELRLKVRLLDAAVDTIFLHDLEGNMIYANEAAYRTRAYEREEFMAMNLRSLVAPLDAAKFDERMAEVAEKGRGVFESTHICRDGSIMPVETRTTAITSGGKTIVMAIVRDITERKRAEEARVRLATAVEQAAETILITDPNGTIQYVNPAFERTTGYGAAETIGRNTRMLKSGVHDGAFYRRMWETLARGEVWTGRLVNRRKDGSHFEEEATISPVRDATGAVVNYVAVKRDVTQEVQLAEQLRESQKLRAIGQLAGGVAHDFNNLLQALLGTVEVLRTRGHDPRVLPRAITELEADVRRGASLTRQLLLFAHRGMVKPESLDVNEVVRDTESLLRRLVRENIRFTCELSAAPLPVEADRGQLEQVLVNLAVNAADAMPDGGTLVIRTSEHGGREVILEVEDSGIGIPDELQPRIFEPFFTTKGADRGIGLGLSVVHGIVTQHGGRVEVKSRVGAGSTFLVALPLHRPEPAHHTQGPTAMTVIAPHSRGERVLLVEDEPGAREGLRQILSMLGYDVTAAPSAEDVVKLPPGQRFDLLLTDLLLPGMHGGELANDMRQKWPGLRVIVMSGYAEDEAVRRGVREGALRFLQKPFDMVTLARELRAALDQKQG
jgi:two-component system cell cycle sensor histidine kinase/response regulator CckA